ncbi:hypothetical protein EYR41_001658 [Orbilia oligospora]|uniref:Uncharacterized protein n=1 Tax=Orbilia oligospora TaxID=2813651 RepID=A0A7C8PJ55_ORBOL|nr:hypothetical protein TWF751_007570 [Orbilia oligospora]KAF3284503.1 hypothetical protein TWF132_009786 [Orbilia oligospora]TGJ74685.1 hypothetical protein EYR41_001658 [Orbilia oligospora]
MIRTDVNSLVVFRFVDVKRNFGAGTTARQKLYKVAPHREALCTPDSYQGSLRREVSAGDTDITIDLLYSSYECEGGMYLRNPNFTL